MIPYKACALIPYRRQAADSIHAFGVILVLRAIILTSFYFCAIIQTRKAIHSIDLRYDVRFDLFWFCKDFVVSHNNMKGYVRLIDTVTKTKRTELEIKKYWWKVIE